MRLNRESDLFNGTDQIRLRGVSKSFRRRGEVGSPGKKFERREVLRDISLTVGKNEIVCVLGRNGSGKTTLVRILSTLVLPDRGEVRVCGLDALREGGRVRRRIGVMLNTGDSGFHPRLSSYANLEYYAALYQVPLKDARTRIERLLSALNLGDRGLDQYQSYSSGMRRRLALARALLPDPPVLLLDEPTLGVDPWMTERIHNLLTEMCRQGKSILCMTNIPAEAKSFGQRLYVLDQGVLSPFNLEEVVLS